MATFDSTHPVAGVSLGIRSAESTFREVNGIRLHTVVAGDPDAPLVVLLHGFPEFWYGWHRQIPALVDAGYRVVVPDQRGYNRSDKPPRVRDYRLAELSGDIRALIENEGRESGHVVGHDWGASVAADLACRHPEVVDRLAILNGTQFAAYWRVLRRNPRQLVRSWYAAFFLLPRFPEWLLSVGDYRVLRDMLGTTQSGSFTDKDIERYHRTWHREGALPGMLNWYRAVPRDSTHPDRERIGAPTCIIWGEDDPALVPELADANLEHCDDGQLERIPDVGHFVQHEAPERVSSLLIEHLGGE